MATGYVKNKQKLKGIRYMLFAVAAVNALITVILGIISSFFENPIPIYLESLIIGLCAYIIPLMIYGRLTKITTKKAEERFYLKRCEGRYIVLALLLGVCWQFVMVIMTLPASFIFGGAGGAAPVNAGELLAAMIVVGVIPAIFEELLFRGIVDGSMAEFNTRAGIIFSSVMFAVLHADIYNFIGYIFMGVILTSIVRRTGSLYSAMVFHLANNVTALLLGYLSSELMYAPITTIVMFAAAVVGFVALCGVLTSMNQKVAPVRATQTATLLGQSFINLPIILCFVTLVTAFIIVRVF